jgi:PKD repeat protein
MSMIEPASHFGDGTTYGSGATYSAATQSLSAVIRASTLSGTAPRLIHFRGDESYGAATYSWNFGDGTTSTQMNPSKIYESPGSFTVTLVVFDAGGESESATVTVTIYPPFDVTQPTFDACGSLTSDMLQIAYDTARNSHLMEIRIRATASDGGFTSFCSPVWTPPNWSLTGGTIRESLDDEITRTLTCEVAADYWTSTEAVLADLSPYKTLLRVERGIYTPLGTVYFPLGVFRVYDVSVTNGRHAQVTAYSQEADIRDYRFITPPGVTASSMTFESLLAPNGLIFGDMGIRAPTVQWIGTNMNSNQGRTKVLPTRTTLTEGRNRLELIKRIADSLNADFYFNRLNQLVMKDKPEFSHPKKLRINAQRGDLEPDEPAVLVQFNKRYTRNNVYNAVVVIGTDTAGKNTYRGIAYDNNPVSKTRWDGPFGRKPRFYSSQFFKSNAQCLAYAERLLLESNQLKSSIDFTFVPNPLVDLGDVIELQYPDASVETHIVRSLDMGLTAESPMSSSTAADSDTQAEMSEM